MRIRNKRKKELPQLSQQFLFILSVAVPEGSTRTCALYGVVPVKLLKALELENLLDLLIPEPPNRPPMRKGVIPMPRVKRPRKPKESE